MSRIKYLLVLLVMASNSISLPCSDGGATEPFLASSAVPLKKLMMDSMKIMDRDMSAVSLDEKNASKVFLEMMIAHHQGAITMASAIMVHTKDKPLSNFAVSIITAQKNEIAYMKLLLDKIRQNQAK